MGKESIGKQNCFLSTLESSDIRVRLVRIWKESVEGVGDTVLGKIVRAINLDA